MGGTELIRITRPGSVGSAYDQLIISPLIDLSSYEDGFSEHVEVGTTSPGQWSSRITVGQGDGRRHFRSGAGSQYPRVVVAEMTPQTRRVVTDDMVTNTARRQAVRRMPGRRRALKLNLHLTFTPIASKRCKRRTRLV